MNAMNETPNYARALLLWQLLDRYHQIVPSLKALRAHAEQTTPLQPDQVEHHRWMATGIFNQMATLWLSGHLDSELLMQVITPSAAHLWLTYVAPLDKAVRVTHRDADPDAKHPIEAFYEALAEGRLITFAKDGDEVQA